MSGRLTHDSLSLLRGLGDLYRRAGEPQRGLVLLLIGAQIAPEDPALLRSLALAFTDSGNPARALNALDRLQALGGSQTQDTLLRAKALWHKGEQAQARACFQDYLALPKGRP
jgi:type III secretion protein Y